LLNTNAYWTPDSPNLPNKKNNSRVDHEEFGKLLRMILA
jgi:hypothetical protein